MLPEAPILLLSPALFLSGGNRLRKPFYDNLKIKKSGIYSGF